MNIIVEKLPDCAATMQVEVPAETVNAERQSVTSIFANQARIPGFRPGKVPVSVVRKKFKKEIEDELKQRLINKGIQEGIKKEDLEVLRVTGVESYETHIDDTATFTANLMLSPDFEVEGYKEIPVELPKIEVSDDDVDEQMDQLRQRLAEYHDIKDRGAEMGDIATIDYEAFLDGQPLAEAFPDTSYMAKGENQPLRLDEETFLTGFCAEIVGLNPGDSREFPLEIPDDFPIEDLKKKEVTYNVDLKNLQEQVVPEWTDELAENFGEGMTVEKLREQVKEEVESQQEKQRQEEMTTQILEYLDKELEFELPQGVVANETQRQVNEIVYRNQMQGRSQEELVEHQDEILNHAAMQAQVNVKTGFILEQIAEKEGIKAEENEILNYVAQMAAQNRTPLKKYLKQLQKQDQIGAIANRIVTSKTLDFLRSNASITEVDRPASEDDKEHDHEH